MAMEKLNSVPTLTVVIPTINEANRLPLLIADLNNWPYKIDINIVDGGSSDQTQLVARLSGCNVFRSPQKNRGLQLKIGASKSKGEWLLFLHADCRMNSYWGKEVERIISNSLSNQYAFYFDFKLKEKNFQYRILETAVKIRSNYFHTPYGDQGLLIHRELYQSIGGFSPLLIMEDIDLILRLSKKHKLKPIGIPLFTDSKKWRRVNILQQSLKNARLRHKWKSGIDLIKISKEYYSE